LILSIFKSRKRKQQNKTDCSRDVYLKLLIPIDWAGFVHDLFTISTIGDQLGVELSLIFSAIELLTTSPQCAELPSSVENAAIASRGWVYACQSKTDAV
jgi:hypothetical protein